LVIFSQCNVDAAALLRLTAFTVNKKICCCQSMATLGATGNWQLAASYWPLAAGCFLLAGAALDRVEL